MILKLRKDIFPLLLSGVKTSTSRFGIREAKVGETLTFVMTEDETVKLNTVVTDVKHCRFKDLTEAEALKEGYNTLDELKNVLKSIYNCNEEDDFTLLHFTLETA